MPELLYEKFEIPQSIVVEENGLKKGRFIAEPLERGFGHTLGNALRRMLLTALEAPAIISFNMEGVQHEYQAIDGIREDVITFVLNLKEVLLKRLPQEGDRITRSIKEIVTTVEVTQQDLAQGQGEKKIRVKDIIPAGDFELVNPDHVIFTVTKPMSKRIALKIGVGRGYVPAERQMIQDRGVYEIICDAIYTPVRLVHYYVENTRVGQDTDFDRLVFEITTDGRISPKEALSFAAKLLMKHLVIFDKMEEREICFDTEQDDQESQGDDLYRKLILNINEIELSVRSTNCLSGAAIETIGELVVMTENRLLQFRNFGKKSLTEIKAKLHEMGLHLGMDLNHLGINYENAKEKIKEMIAEFKAKGDAK